MKVFWTCFKGRTYRICRWIRSRLGKKHSGHRMTSIQPQHLEKMCNFILKVYYTLCILHTSLLNIYSFSLDGSDHFELSYKEKSPNWVTWLFIPSLNGPRKLCLWSSRLCFTSLSLFFSEIVSHHCLLPAATAPFHLWSVPKAVNHELIQWAVVYTSLLEVYSDMDSYFKKWEKQFGEKMRSYCGQVYREHYQLLT